MNEEQIKTLEQWIACERMSNKAMAEARVDGSNGAVTKAQNAFKTACDAAGRAFAVLRVQFGLSLPPTPAPTVMDEVDADAR